MQLSHCTSKFGPSDIYNVIYLDSPDLDIKASLGKYGEVWKIFFRANELFV